MGEHSPAHDAIGTRNTPRGPWIVDRSGSVVRIQRSRRFRGLDLWATSDRRQAIPVSRVNYYVMRSSVVLCDALKSDCDDRTIHRC
jgi:hypothetical protein